MNKIKMGREIILGMQFLGMDTAKFLEMKKEHGSLSRLHKFIEDQLIGK